MGTGSKPDNTSYWMTYGVGYVGGSGSVREDLLDLITNIDPWDTPFFSAAPKSTAKSITHEWLVDALAATSTAGAYEGADFSADALTNRSRLSNMTQIFRKDILVSDTLRAVDTVGISDEYQYQVMKGMREVARNIESAIFSGAAQITGGTATARGMKSLGNFLAATSNCISSTVIATADGCLISTALVNYMMEQCYTNGGNPDTLWVSPGVKADFSKAALASQFVRNLAATDKKLTMNVDVYESDFGLLAIVPDRWIPQSTSGAATAVSASGYSFYITERSKNRIAFLRPIRHVPLAKGGDATRGFIVGELTLECLHPSAHIRCTGIIT